MNRVPSALRQCYLLYITPSVCTSLSTDGDVNMSQADFVTYNKEVVGWATAHMDPADLGESPLLLVREQWHTHTHTHIQALS
jgi:hypothetical protein